MNMCAIIKTSFPWIISLTRSEVVERLFSALSKNGNPRKKKKIIMGKPWNFMDLGRSISFQFPILFLAKHF